MIDKSEYRRRKRSLARADAIRGPDGQPVAQVERFSLGRRFGEGSGTGGVDPIAASKVDRMPWMFRA